MRVIKEYVARTPWAFRFRTQLVRIVKKGVHRVPPPLAGKGVDLCLEGYPSSGNSFAVNMIRKGKPGIVISSHFHSIANVKLALKHGVPTVILIRDPSEAIASRVVRFGISVSEAVWDYVDFYDWVFERIDDVKVVEFRMVVKKTQRFVAGVARHAGIALEYEDLDRTKRQVKNEMKEWFVAKGGEIGLPSGDRQKRKEECRAEMEGCSAWKSALDIYDSILKATCGQ